VSFRRRAALAPHDLPDQQLKPTGRRSAKVWRFFDDVRALCAIALIGVAQVAWDLFVTRPRSYPYHAAITTLLIGLAVWRRRAELLRAVSRR
jgi:hypothetical protein